MFKFLMNLITGYFIIKLIFGDDEDNEDDE